MRRSSKPKAPLLFRLEADAGLAAPGAMNAGGGANDADVGPEGCLRCAKLGRPAARLAAIAAAQC